MRFAVYFELACALFPGESLEDVCDNLTGAVPELCELAPAKSALHGMRSRLGPEAMRAVFEAVAVPVAGPDTLGARWRGLRTLAVDGFTVEMPDSAVNRAHFSGPSTRPAGGEVVTAGYPQARLVTLVETGTRAALGAAIGTYLTGEPELAAQVATAAGKGDVVIFDRNFPSVALWKAYRATGAHLVMRAKKSVARDVVQALADGSALVRMYRDGRRSPDPERSVTARLIEYEIANGEVIRLLTSLEDPELHPADEIARLYAERWQSEIANLQVKTLQITPGTMLRSHDPDQVRQELWAHLALNHALTRLMTLMADERREDPERVSFTKVLKEVRRSVIRQIAATCAQAVTRALDIADDLRRYRNPERTPRESDRTVKRVRQRYKLRRTEPGQPITRPSTPQTIRLLPTTAS
jgi:Transposase DDE domain/Insertion element 4 transposase N-terminal